MRTLKWLSCLAAVLLLVGSSSVRAQLPANEIEGTWRMVSQKLVYPDTVINQSGNWGPGYKILNSTHFAWGRETGDGETVLAGGGQYEYYPEQDVYIEHIEYHSDTALNGATIRFTARIEGDTWYHIGEVGDYQLREVWKRVDPEQAWGEKRTDSLATGGQIRETGQEE